MPETETETTEDATPSNEELAAEVSGLRSDVRMIIDKLSGTKDEAHAAAQQHTQDRLDRPSAATSVVAEDIRAALAKQREDDTAAASKKSHDDHHAAMEERITGMAEKTPETPPRRVERFMWGAR